MSDIYAFDKTAIDPSDIARIEAEARRLRAEALTNGLRAVRAWVAGLFAPGARTA